MIISPSWHRELLLSLRIPALSHSSCYNMSSAWVGGGDIQVMSLLLLTSNIAVLAPGITSLSLRIPAMSYARVNMSSAHRGYGNVPACLQVHAVAPGIRFVTTILAMSNSSCYNMSSAWSGEYKAMSLLRLPSNIAVWHRELLRHFSRYRRCPTARVTI
ncbi:hypothetical protein J6590_036092 [Homalodisca vitripennis]|nr:hypothetical protein J6590_036092 [Homalodisca vitripennis]